MVVRATMDFDEFAKRRICRCRQRQAQSRGDTQGCSFPGHLRDWQNIIGKHSQSLRCKLDSKRAFSCILGIWKYDEVAIDFDRCTVKAQAPWPFLRECASKLCRQ